MGLAHWNEVEAVRRAKGELDATWQALGDAAGAVGVGLNRVRVAPGRMPTPPHVHGAAEELYYVLGGSGLAWQDGAVHQVRPGDCVIQRANELEHTFVAGLARETIDAGRRGSVPHCHSAEEELFAILAGTATLELRPSPQRRGAYEEHELRAGHVVARPAGTGVSHSFLAGPEGATMLVYGTRRPNDVCWYPRSRKINWRGLGVIGRVEVLDYDDGEPDD